MKNCRDAWVALKTQPDLHVHRMFFASFFFKCHSVVARAKMNLNFEPNKEIHQLMLLQFLTVTRHVNHLLKFIPGKSGWNRPFKHFSPFYRVSPPYRAGSPHVNRCGQNVRGAGSPPLDPPLITAMISKRILVSFPQFKCMSLIHRSFITKIS